MVRVRPVFCFTRSTSRGLYALGSKVAAKIARATITRTISPTAPQRTHFSAFMSPPAPESSRLHQASRGEWFRPRDLRAERTPAPAGQHLFEQVAVATHDHVDLVTAADQVIDPRSLDRLKPRQELPPVHPGLFQPLHQPSTGTAGGAERLGKHLEGQDRVGVLPEGLAHSPEDVLLV